MKGAALLLTDPSPCLRCLALTALFGRAADDPEVLELAGLRGADPLAGELLALQERDGSWSASLQSALWGGGSRVLATAFALARLGFLGLTGPGLGGPDPAAPWEAAIARGAAYLFSQQLPDGAWPLPGGYDLLDGSSDLPPSERYNMIPMQTAIPLRGLAACGYASDPRTERGYEWLLAQRLEDGAWPTGTAAGVFGRVAGYRRLAGSTWGCRSNTTAALLALALHPARRTSAPAQRALDLLLARDGREQSGLGFEVARLVGAEPARGFFTYYARYDLALTLDLCRRAGLTAADERVGRLAAFVRSLQGPYGLWEYRERPQVSRWLSLDLLRSLANLL